MSKNLSMLSKGQKGKVRTVKAGKTATKRLYELGFNTGAAFTVIKNDNGPIIVSLHGNKVALGRGLASKVLLEA
ncbi:MAG: hypothetical protein GX345_00460 [Clostridiales bacterium]|nr:hypothetical protein [Clostridiales bacterium]